MEGYEDLLWQALFDLRAEVEELLRDTKPETPLPRWRLFTLAPGIYWPCQGNPRMAQAEGCTLSLPRRGETRDCWLVNALMRACRGQPRLILRALRRIEAATAWCRARRAGRERMVQEILRQQAGAVETLETLAALQALAQGGKNM